MINKVKKLVSKTTLILSLALIVLSDVWASDIVVGSWNIQRLGHGNNKSYPALATIASKVDLLAVQEVMTQEGIDKLEQALEKLTGEPWEGLTSHALGSSSYKEMYSFLWRKSAVEYLDGAVVYLDRGNHFIREPFSARFKSRRDNSTLAIGTVHILYGKSIQDRAPEIKALADYWLWMQDVYQGTPIALIGDFNLAPSNKAWDALKAHASPLINQGATTLSSNDGQFANLYDNIWVEKKTALDVRSAGIIEFPKMLGWDHKKSRKHVSDHAPIYMVLGNAKLDTGTATMATPALAPAPAKQSKVSAGSIKGNKNSKIYHRPDCPSYNRMSSKNVATFSTVAEAKAAGFRLAGNCP